MTPIAGYEHLSDSERKLFVVAHRKHLATVPEKDREQYGLGQVVEVKANRQDHAVEARFINGVWHKYTAEGALR